MANEIQSNGTLNALKGGAKVSRTLSVNVNMSGSNMVSNTVTVTTGGITLDLGSISTIGYVMFNNLDPTNFITFGENGTSYPVKVIAGKFAGPFQWNGAAIHAKADTASCVLQYDLVEA